MLAIVTWYEWFKAFHIVAAVIWVGGGFMIQILAVRIQHADEPSRLAAFARDVEFVGTRIFLPAALVVLAFGFALVERGDWGYDRFFIIWGLAASFASAILGSTFLGPESGRIGKLIEEQGPDFPEVQRRLARIFVVSRIELGILLLTIFFMTLKPWL